MPSKRAKELRLQRGSNRLQDGCMDASSPGVQPSVRLSATGLIANRAWAADGRGRMAGLHVWEWDRGANLSAIAGGSRHPRNT